MLTVFILMNVVTGCFQAPSGLGFGTIGGGGGAGPTSIFSSQKTAIDPLVKNFLLQIKYFFLFSPHCL
jgi:hypothetical protein